jgi:hypothetical protein
MSGKERRTAPRKDCAVPLRFRVLADGRFAAAEEAVDEFEGPPVQAFRNLATIPGETVNLSERGMYFRKKCAARRESSTSKTTPTSRVSRVWERPSRDSSRWHP